MRAPLLPYELAAAYDGFFSSHLHLIFASDQLVAQATSWQARNAALRLLFGTGSGEGLPVLPSHVRTDHTAGLPR